MAPRKRIVLDEEQEVVTEYQKQEPRMNKNYRQFLNKRTLIIVAFIVLLIGFLHYYTQYKKLSKSPSEVAKEKTVKLLGEVSKLAIVPNDPNVQIATVTDVEKLKGQPFFNSAQNGDEILIFPSTREAILYRPSVRKIVSISQLAPAPTSTSTAAASLSAYKKNATSTATSSKSR